MTTKRKKFTHQQEGPNTQKAPSSLYNHSRCRRHQPRLTNINTSQLNTSQHAFMKIHL